MDNVFDLNYAPTPLTNVGFSYERTSSTPGVDGFGERRPVAWNSLQYRTDPAFTVAPGFGTFTLPAGYDGLWYFSSRYRWSGGPRQLFWLSIEKNTVDTHITNRSFNDADTDNPQFQNLIVSGIVPMVAGDVIRIVQQRQEGQFMNGAEAGNAQNTEFWGKWLGA